jgi:FkbM family methyltransferase
MRQLARRALFALARLFYRLPDFPGRNRLFTIALRNAQRLGPPVVVEIEGLSLQLDLRDGLCRGLWAERAFPQGHALKAMCREGDVVIDAGANVGHMALLAAKAVGPTGHVIAIEPAERSFSLLQANAERNFPGRITAIRAACDETDGTATLFVSEYSEEFNSLRPDSVLDAGHQEVVPARSLGSLSRELDLTPDVVKVDVEGAEWPALKGLFDGGDAPRPRSLMVEAYSVNTRGFGYQPSTMCRWLGERGYDLTLSRDSREFEYSDARADGPLLHDLVARRIGNKPPAPNEPDEPSAPPAQPGA